ncbi:MAG TPA: DUF1361 domain-containing protein [Iamia sp.]|nr:DUF1361 domain-containing protein [Iamia sp.]
MVLDLVDRYVELVRGLALGSGPWMVFNATLAAIPAVLAVALFHRPRRPSVAWLGGVGLFLLFLPNAPYVITDLIHLRSMLEGNPGTRVSDMVPAGVLALLVVWGVGCYAVALAEVDRALARRAALARHRVAIRSAIHLACGFGVVLGRIPRLHSWHVVTRPHATVDGIVGVLHPLAVPLVVALALAFALAASALTVVARAAWARTVEVADGLARTALVRRALG